MSRNCPDNAIIKLNGRGPPGASTFSVEPVPAAGTESDDHSEILDSLPLGAVSLETDDPELPIHHWPASDWRERYPHWNNPGILPCRELGDCYAMVAEAILTTQQPYPGDELFENPRLLPELRFNVE